MNALIELVPATRLILWFRPDPYRLHLREPLLETQNAAAYLARTFPQPTWGPCASRARSPS